MRINLYRRVFLAYTDRTRSFHYYLASTYPAFRDSPFSFYFLDYLRKARFLRQGCFICLYNRRIEQKRKVVELPV